METTALYFDQDEDYLTICGLFGLDPADPKVSGKDTDPNTGYIIKAAKRQGWRLVATVDDLDEAAAKAIPGQETVAISALNSGSEYKVFIKG